MWEARFATWIYGHFFSWFLLGLVGPLCLPSNWPHHQLWTDLAKVGSWGEELELVCLFVLIALPPTPPHNPLIGTLEAQHSSNNQQWKQEHNVYTK